MARAAAEKTRQPGTLRVVTKRAKGKEYRRWQWRTHRRTDTGWTTVDVELGNDLTGLRTRTLVALGELKAPLLVERWARLYIRPWRVLPAWTGMPTDARRHQRAAWWIELPRSADDQVKLRFRSLDGWTDFRMARRSMSDAAQTATSIWRSLTDDPIIELARLLWQEKEAQQRVDAIAQEQIELRRQRRRGELNQRDYEADERGTYQRLEQWEVVVSASCKRYDDLLKEVLDAMPRTRRDEYRTKILCRVDQLLNSQQQQQRWRSDHWDANTLTWHV